jgi:hypothetical protein
MILAACLSCVALIGSASSTMPEPQPAKTIVRQIDHVLFVTPGGRTLVELLTQTLGLPIVFPQAGEAWTASTGVGFGNVTLEVFHRPPAPPGNAPKAGRITSLALQPTNLEEALKELQLRRIVDDVPSQNPRAAGAAVPRWRTVGLKGFGHGVFLIQYVFDMDERRARFDRILRERKGGALGVVRVHEVVIATDEPDQVRAQWEALLGPALSPREDVWVAGDGPRIRLVKRGDARAGDFIVEVTSLSRAARALRRIDIAAVTTRREIRIDPDSMLGLRLVLRQHRRGLLGGTSFRRR